jgi:Cu2+-exporting ATPase
MLSTADLEPALCHQVEKRSYHVVHQNDRRIRLCIPGLGYEPEYANHLQELISSLHFVTEVHLNPNAHSLAVEYKLEGNSSSRLREKIIRCIEDNSLTEILEEQLKLGSHEDDSELVSSKEVEYHVVHQNQQRIRLKVPLLAEDSEYGEKLKYLIKSRLEVTEVRINRAAASIAVEFENLGSDEQTLSLRRQQLVAILKQALTTDIKVANIHCQEQTTDNDQNYWEHYSERLGLPALSLGLSLGAFVGLPLPEFLLAGSIFLAAMPVFKRAWTAIQQNQQLTIDFLDGMAIGLHTVNGSYFPSTLMLGMIEGGEAIRDMTMRGSERASLNLLDCLNKQALIERDGKEVEVLVKEIVEGDQVIVYPGDQIPVDGYIISGNGLVDQCKLTGESLPVSVSEGDEVLASTLLVEGKLSIFTKKTGNNTRAGATVALMQSAPVHDTRMGNYAAIVANQMVVPTLAASLVVGLSSGDINRAISILTLDVGTGMRISIPTTIMSALTYAAQNGVHIRSGRALEKLAEIDTLVFDKTGTLTQGRAGVTGIKLTNDTCSEQELLSLAATAEQGLSHPVAEAIIRHARETKVPIYECLTWDYRVGLGVVATIKDKKLLVGSHRLMAQENISLDILNQRYPNIKSGSNSLVYVARDGRLLGVILYSDPPRPESRYIIQELQAQSITPYMLSGDVNRVAKAVAGELGIHSDCVYAEAFPEGKVEIVKALHDSGKTVAFCGDGINDSAALAYADVSISFGGATDIARETADVVLMENDLRGLLLAIQVAKYAMKIVWENAALVVVPNIGAVIAGIFLAIDPVLAIIINNGSAILAELNGLRPLLGSDELKSLVPSVPQPVKQNMDVVDDKPHSAPENSCTEHARDIMVVPREISNSVLAFPISETDKEKQSLPKKVNRAKRKKKLQSSLS